MNPVLDKLDSLPVEIRAIIEGDEIISVIDNICNESDIPYSWRGELIRATVRVLCGLLPPKEFVPFIMDEYFLEHDEALAIASKINEKIFSAVKPQLASLYNIEDKKIAKKLQVPKKPKTEAIVEDVDNTEVASPYDMQYATPTVQDLMPKNVPNINIVHPSILNQKPTASPVIPQNDDVIPPPPVHNQFAQSSFGLDTPPPPQTHTQPIMNDINVPPPPVHNINSFNQTTPPPQTESTLANKLGGLRFDNYREPI